MNKNNKEHLLKFLNTDLRESIENIEVDTHQRAEASAGIPNYTQETNLKLFNDWYIKITANGIINRTDVSVNIEWTGYILVELSHNNSTLSFTYSIDEMRPVFLIIKELYSEQQEKLFTKFYSAFIR